MNKIVLSILALMFCLASCTSEKKELVMTKELDQNWTFRQFGTDEWMKASVPGCVHTDLIDNGKIEDPFYRLNEHNLQWIDKVNWEYKTTFTIDEATFSNNRIALDFKGLDTYADVYVNGKLLLSADNMFREWLLDIKEAAVQGENELLIVFRSPIVEGLKKYDANEYVIPVSDNDLAKIGQVEGNKQVSIYTRKAGYHFGWDWGSRLVSSGLWRPVILTSWNEARLENIQLIQNSVAEENANLTAVFEIDAETDQQAVLEIENEGNILAKQTITLTKGISSYKVDFDIKNPILWWTNGLGEAHLYNIIGKLTIGNQTTSICDRIGIRTLELVREKDQAGTTFYFKLNGVPVFMKGANYIPNDIFETRVSDEMYRNVVNTSKISNFNMLRVWGGGIYENDIFYDLCDEAGILIWQDFMFACAMFPGDEAFLENVKKEAEDNVKRLRNHPCIALWCGNNEILSAWTGWGWSKREEAKNPENAAKIWKAYTDIFHEILPNAVKEFDSDRSYIGSSPSSGLGIPADKINGDDHYWGVWWGQEPFENYEKNIARFMSEYGFQSFPEMKSIKQYAIPEDFDIFSEVMKSHQRSSIGNGTIENYLLMSYKKPKDFESFLYANHVLQAEGIKIAIEAHRRAAPYCMGSLFWQINDSWPVASWSSTDYYQRWKALQYYAKKAFEPVLVAPVAINDSVTINIINDNLKEISNAQLTIKALDVDGNEIRKVSQEISIPANSSDIYFQQDKEDFMQGLNPRNQFIYVELSKDEKILSSNILYLNAIKDFDLPKATISHEIQTSENGFIITVKTDKLAKNLYMTIGDEEGFFSDNYFDLLPNSEVSVNLNTKISREKLDEVFNIKTLDMAF